MALPARFRSLQPSGPSGRGSLPAVARDKALTGSIQTPDMSLRTALLVVAAGTLLLAGCADSLGGDTPAADRQTPATATPSQLPASEVTDRALEAETSYVSARLENASCLRSWGIGEYTTNAEATVLDRTERGVIVEAQRPYSWEKNASPVDGASNARSVADLVSNARYLVTANDTVRQSGPSIDPC